MSRSDFIAGRVLIILATISPVTVTQLSRATGRHPSTIRSALALLVARGEVQALAGQHRRSARDGFAPYLAFKRCA